MYTHTLRVSIVKNQEISTHLSVLRPDMEKHFLFVDTFQKPNLQLQAKAKMSRVSPV